jgi:hypothetical protein
MERQPDNLFQWISRCLLAPRLDLFLVRNSNLLDPSYGQDKKERKDVWELQPY